MSGLENNNLKMARPAIFLDRDGTINIDKHYLYKIEDFEYIDGAIEALKYLQKLGFLLVIITNQSGIARGYYNEYDFQTLNDWMISDLFNKGINIDKVYYCPHHPKAKLIKYRMDCNCRKPKTGLYWKAQKELNIDMSKSFVIGDNERDLEICFESEVKGILLSSLVEYEHQVGFIAKSWKEILEFIKNM